MKILSYIKKPFIYLLSKSKAWYKNTFIEPSKKRYYTSLEGLPLKNWLKICEGDYTYTRKNRKKGRNNKDLLAFIYINDDYINRFGLGKQYLKILNLLRKKALLELDYVITGDRAKLTAIEIEEANLKTSYENKGKPITIETTLIYISKFLGTWVNVETVTALEYFSLVDSLEAYNKEIESYSKETRKNKKR